MRRRGRRGPAWRPAAGLEACPTSLTAEGVVEEAGEAEAGAAELELDGGGGGADVIVAEDGGAGGGERGVGGVAGDVVGLPGPAGGGALLEAAALEEARLAEEALAEAGLGGGAFDERGVPEAVEVGGAVAEDDGEIVAAAVAAVAGVEGLVEVGGEVDEELEGFGAGGGGLGAVSEAGLHLGDDADDAAGGGAEGLPGAVRRGDGQVDVVPGGGLLALGADLVGPGGDGFERLAGLEEAGDFGLRPGVEVEGGEGGDEAVAFAAPAEGGRQEEERDGEDAKQGAHNLILSSFWGGRASVKGAFCMQYTSARGLAGLACAGSLALLTAITFVYQLPSTFFPYAGGPLALDVFALLIWYLIYAAVSFPFDVWAGYWLPCRHGGVCRLFPVYLGRLTRGLAAQGLIMTASAALMLVAGRQWGMWGAGAALAVMLGMLGGMRGRVARYLGAEQDRAAGWRSWMLAGAWNLAGFALSAALPWCGVTTVYGLVETLLGCTLWSLAGLAVLPRVDRRAAGLALYLSWASFGLLSRATAAKAGLPEEWAA